jgi:hypothetical protein
MVEYQKTLLTYIDIMGFRKMIAESQKDPTKINVILDILKKTREQTAITYKKIVTTRTSIDAMEARNFSDLILRVTPLGLGTVNMKQAISMECLILTSIQCELFLKSGILLRGGMCVDDLYFENDIVFGPALVNAYELENTIAVFPRIIVDRQSFMLHRDEMELAIGVFLQRGDDGAYFIDYLYSVYINALALSEFKTHETQLLSVHKKQVETKLKEFAGQNDRIKQKALWLALYHNSVLNRLMAWNPAKIDTFRELLISERQLEI